MLMLKNAGLAPDTLNASVFQFSSVVCRDESDIAETAIPRVLLTFFLQLRNSKQNRAWN